MIDSRLVLWAGSILGLLSMFSCGGGVEVEAPREEAAAEIPQESVSPPPMDEAAMMEAWQAAMTPGEAHAELAALAGTFEVMTRMWMDPSAPPSDTLGTCVNELVLGGRFLAQKVTGEVMGMPFEGLSYMGYDNVLKEYVSTWIDNMGTGIMNARGTKKSDGTIEMVAEYPDPATGRMVKFREVFTIADPDHHSMVMYVVNPDGTETKNMEVHYTRKQ